MAGGSWDPTASAVRPGLYINFVEAAIAQIQGGARGTVAIPLKAYGVGAVAKSVYTVETVKEATDLFGAANIGSISKAFQGGAKEVLVYAMPVYDALTTVQDHTDMRATFDAYPFNVFVFDGEVTSAEQDATLAWMKVNKADGKHFMVVFGGSTADDQDPAIGDARSVRLSDDYAVNLIVGVTVGGVASNSSQYAPWVAGLVAGTPINKSITYAQAPVDDVTKRMTNAQIKASLQKGSLVLVNDGEKVKVERGVVTSTTSSKTVKIRKIRAHQAISMDITKTASDSYIGKVDNNVDGQKALISAIKAYLERLADSNVITQAIYVDLSKDFPSVGDSVYLDVKIVEVDSMEELYLTVSVG
jgi:archaellum component FlaC